MDHRDLASQIGGLAALEDPLRRRLYLYVASRHAEVSRDEAARAVGVSRALAGFHLDRLATEGLLETSFRRLSGRSGPGAGRPSKLYRRSDRQLAISLPERRYELAARLLAIAVDAGGSRRAANALEKAARSVGEGIGVEAAVTAGARAGKRRRRAAAVAALAAQGYEPEEDSGEVVLRNCPFHALVGEHRDLVCGMNLALVDGVVSGLELEGMEAVLEPAPGRCCVSLKRTAKNG